MKEEIAKVQYVDIDLFISISVAMLGLILTGFLTVFKMIAGMKSDLSKSNEVIAVAARNNVSDETSIKEIKNEMMLMKEQRAKDVLQFTEVISKLNVTLGKIEVTLENSNSLMEKFERRLEDQGKEIVELKINNNGNI